MLVPVFIVVAAVAADIPPVAHDAIVAIDIAAGVVGMDLALRMATLNPGAILGGDAGRFVVGGPASLVRFAWSQGDPHLGIDLVLAGDRDVDLADGDGA